MNLITVQIESRINNHLAYYFINEDRIELNIPIDRIEGISYYHDSNSDNEDINHAIIITSNLGAIRCIDTYQEVIKKIKK